MDDMKEILFTDRHEEAKDHLKVHVSTWNLGENRPPTKFENGSEENWRRFVEMRPTVKNGAATGAATGTATGAVTDAATGAATDAATGAATLLQQVPRHSNSRKDDRRTDKVTFRVS